MVLCEGTGVWGCEVKGASGSVHPGALFRFGEVGIGAGSTASLSRIPLDLLRIRTHETAREARKRAAQLAAQTAHGKQKIRCIANT